MQERPELYDEITLDAMHGPLCLGARVPDWLSCRGASFRLLLSRRGFFSLIVTGIILVLPGLKKTSPELAQRPAMFARKVRS